MDEGQFSTPYRLKDGHNFVRTIVGCDHIWSSNLGSPNQSGSEPRLSFFHSELFYQTSETPVTIHKVVLLSGLLISTVLPHRNLYWKINLSAKCQLHWSYVNEIPETPSPVSGSLRITLGCCVTSTDN